MAQRSAKQLDIHQFLCYNHLTMSPLYSLPKDFHPKNCSIRTYGIYIINWFKVKAGFEDHRGIGRFGVVENFIFELNNIQHRRRWQENRFVGSKAGQAPVSQGRNWLRTATLFGHTWSHFPHNLLLKEGNRDMMNWQHSSRAAAKRAHVLIVGSTTEVTFRMYFWNTSS